MAKRVVGHCTPGCGACCRLLALPYVLGTPAVHDDLARMVIGGTVDPEGRAFLRARGVALWPLPGGGTRATVPLDPHPLPWFRRTEGGVLQTYFHSTCPQLTEDGRCVLYGQPDRPQTCRDWPYPQTDLAVVPACTYWIIEDAAAPSPGAAVAATHPTLEEVTA